MRFTVGLLALIAIVALSEALPRRHLPLPVHRIRRDAHDNAWMTDEQKAVVKELSASGDMTALKNKIMEFYKALPQAEQDKHNEHYKKECVKWIKDVASEEEVAELKALKNAGDKDALEKKVAEYKERLDEKTRSIVTAWEPECRELWKMTKSRKMRSSSTIFEDFTEWMTDEQRNELAAEKEAGKPFADLRAKTLSFLGALDADKQAEIKEKAKGKCKAFFAKLATEAEMAQLKELYETGKIAEAKDVINGIIERQEDQTLAKKYQSVCMDVYGVNTKKRRDINEKIEKHLSWLNTEQKQELRDMKAAGKTNVEIKEKVMSFLHGLDAGKKKETKEKMTKECYAWLNEAASKDEVDELHKLHETDHNACKIKVREYIKRLPAARQEEVNKNLPFCERIWYGDHDHHGHGHGHGHHGNAGHKAHKHHRRHLSVTHLEKYIGWLSAEQKKEIEALEASGAEYKQVIEKVTEFYKELPEDKQNEVKDEFKNKCASWAPDVATEAEIAELKKLHESQEFDGVNEKLKLFYNRLPEERRHEIDHVKDICKKVWGMQVPQSRRRRDEHKHSVEEALKEYLSWLTDEQKETIKGLKEDRPALEKKIWEFYEETSGELREKAREGLKGGCRHFIGHAIGEEKSAEMKKLRESGASFDQMKSKLDEFIGQIEDPTEKAKAAKAAEGCGKVFKEEKASRKRREEDHKHSIEEALDKYLTWLSGEQKDAIKGLKDDKEALVKKIWEFYDETSGEEREKAREGLKGGCRHFIGHAIGKEHSAEMKKLLESGASQDQIEKKLYEFIGQISDETVKARTTKAADSCGSVFKEEKASRKRREGEHKHTTEENLEKYLTWLSDEQKDEFKKLDGDKEGQVKKIWEFYHKTSGEDRVKAREGLKAGCKHHIGHAIGTEKSAEMKKLFESGASHDEIEKKLHELIGQIENVGLRAGAKEAAESCGRVFKEVKASRRRRDHHEHTLESALDTFLDWLTDEQKEELKANKEDKKGLYERVEKYFESASAGVKPVAAEKIKGACKHMVKDVLGEEKANELKKLKESGASHDQMEEKVKSLIAGIADEKDKERAERATSVCKKAFAFKSASRKRRDHHEHTLENALETFLDWLTDEQKEELKANKEDKKGLYEKVLGYYKSASAEVKPVAQEKLKNACRHMMKDVVGEEKAGEMKKLKESGATKEQLSDKAMELIGGIEDPAKKERAERASVVCKAIYNIN